MTRTLAYSLMVFLACLSPQAQADKPTAGMYSITTSMESDTGVLVQSDTMTECLTEEDVQRDPDAFVGGREGTENCEVGDYVMDGGRMTMSMICQTPAGELTMKTDGTFHATGYTMTSNIQISSGGATTNMKSTGVAKRIGDC